jgi:hypothetical protein
MGGGGGGAGGAIRLFAVGTATLGSSLVQATGAGGGSASCGSTSGGGGGVGRVGVAAAILTGSTSPALDPR